MLCQDYTDITSNTTSVKCFVFGAKERRWWVRSRIYEQKEVHLDVYWIVHNSMVSLCSCIPKLEISLLSMKILKPLTLEVHGCLHGARDLPLLLGLPRGLRVRKSA